MPKSIRIRGGVVASAVADDSNVPEAHKGLHASLYGDVAAHAAEAAYEPIAGEDDGTALVPVDPFLAKRDGARPPGVFAIHDESGRLQFVGYSRNIVLSVRSLRSRLGSARVASVRAQVVSGRELQSRAALARRAQEWIDSAPGGETPPGNGAEAALWTGAISSGGGSGSSGGSSPLHLSVDAAAMSPAELDAYEQRKTKLRKAMGDKAVMAEAAVAEPTNDERRLRMIAAMEVGAFVCARVCVRSCVRVCVRWVGLPTPGGLALPPPSDRALIHPSIPRSPSSHLPSPFIQNSATTGAR